MREFYQFCPLPLPWFHSVRRRSEPVSALRNFVMRLRWELSRKPAYRAKCLVQAGLWPLRTLAMILASTWRWGGYLKRKHGVSFRRQVAQQLWLTNVLNIPSKKYYEYRFYEPQRLRDAHLYLFGVEMRFLLRQLNAKACDIDETRDKVRFLRQCEEANLPTIPILAIFEKDRPVEWVGAERLPAEDLFVKARRLSNSRGAEWWKYSRDAREWVNGSLHFDEAKLLGHFQRRQHPCLVQPKKNNCPDLARFSLGALCTVRIVTYRQGEGDFRALHSFLKMPCGNADSDAPSAGGIFAEVDLETGTLGVGYSSTVGRDRFSTHPDTGAVIAGATLAEWAGMLALAKRAHAHFTVPSIGWDLAVDEAGPYLVEANASWGAEVIQTASDRPIGRRAFSDWYLGQLGAHL